MPYADGLTSTPAPEPGLLQRPGYRLEGSGRRELTLLEWLEYTDDIYAEVVLVWRRVSAGWPSLTSGWSTPMTSTRT